MALKNLASSKKKDKKAIAADVEAGKQQQEAILQMLARFDASLVYSDRALFVSDLETHSESQSFKLSAPLKKLILANLSERDELASICIDSNGNPEADPELRDYENVPLKESTTKYFEREVQPYVPDAWINESVKDQKDGLLAK